MGPGLSPRPMLHSAGPAMRTDPAKFDLLLVYVLVIEVDHVLGDIAVEILHREMA